MAKPTRHRRSILARSLIAEPLEARRLLAATLDAFGVLTVTGTGGKDIVQFQVADSNNGPANSFAVVESTTTAASPPLSFPTTQQILDFIDSGSQPVVTNFVISEVREIRINSLGGDDLIIMGRTLPVPASIDSGDGNDSVSAGIRDDTITGGPGNDYLFGNDSNDVLGGALGGDEILGGDGFDLADFKTRTVPLTINVNNLTGDGQSGENDNVRTDMEGVIGGSGNDSINASGALSGFYLDGADGNDTLTGSEFDDTVIGGTGSDSVAGGGGNDIIFDEDSNADEIDGGAGFNVAFVDSIDSHTNVLGVDEAPSQDPELSAGGSATLSSGVLTITGGATSDLAGLQLSQDGLSLFVFEVVDLPNADLDNDVFVSEFVLADVQSVVANMGSGNDFFHGIDFQGTISVNGGAGNDVLAGGAGDDVLNGGDGDDWLFGRGGDDTLDGGLGGDYMSGGPGTDTVDYSNRNDDVLVGIGQIRDDGSRGEGDNVQLDIEVVIGGNGNDRLNTQGTTGVRFIGGPGRDIITGGPAADDYSLLDGEVDTVRGGGGGDTVLDSDPSDDIDLDA